MLKRRMSKKPKKKGKRMGTCKDEMKPSNDKSKGLLAKMGAKLKGNYKPKVDAVKMADSFADQLQELETKLDALIGVKTDDLANEKGRESYNQKALDKLKEMYANLYKVAEGVEEYSKLN